MSDRDDSTLIQTGDPYRRMFDAHPDAMTIYDTETLGYLTVNDAAIQRYGYSRDQFLSMTIKDIRPDDDVPALLSTVSKLVGHSKSGIWQHRTADGSIILVDITSEAITFNGRPARMVLARDMTEQFEARMLLHQSEERFRLAARATSDVIWDWDISTDLIWWSEGLTELFQYEANRTEPITTGWIDRIHPDDRDRIVGEIDNFLAGRDENWSGEYRFLKKDGSEALVSDRGFAIRNAGGKALRMVGSLSDITDQRALEERLNQTQRLEVVGQLTGGIAHDFNNLLTVILGNADAIAGNLPPESTLGRLARMTHTAAERGADLTSRLLAFARKQALEPRTVDVSDLLKGMNDLLRQTMSEAVSVEISTKPDLWMCEIDPIQLETAILNLCINARDAMDNGGKLAIDVTNTHLDDDYADRHPDVTPGDYVMVAISDNGSGMTPEVAERAFEPFFTTKTAGNGTGLGLSMVYGFIKQSRGHIKIYSEVNEGTAVKLYLPRADAGTAADTPHTAPGSIPTGTERILVVEDDDLVRDYVMRQLEGLGYDVTSAGNGHEAIQILEQQADFDLLFTDVVMPGGMSGRQLAEKAAKILPGLRILYTSGYTENAIVHHGRLDAGVNLLNKPYRLTELATRVRTVIDKDPGAGQV